MCGIIGYIGKNKAKDILINGLKNLEYRGYDSAGIALKNENTKIIKSIGKIVNLEEKLKDYDIDNYNMGIAHTRWATHGGVTLENAHPHTYGKITLVHNGIIENAKELKDELIKEGKVFNSDTDTEVIAVLLDKYLEDDIIKTINKVMDILVGSYALGILIEDIKDRIYIVKNNSPLIVGLGENENFFASDSTAITEYTNKIILMDDKEIGVIYKDKVEIYIDNKLIEKDIEEIDDDISVKGKNGYSHYMLKEINEEPMLLDKVLGKYLDNVDLLPDLTKYEEIHLVACGSALYAGMIGKTLFEEKCNVRAENYVASEYRYKNNIYNRNTLVIVISQSGETADTIAALKYAKEMRQDTLALVNKKTSTIARLADKTILIEAGEEVAVATTKAYIMQVALLSLLSLKLASDKKLMKIDKYLDEFRKLPEYVKNIIDNDSMYKEVAKKIKDKENIFFIGRKLDYAISMEGSLKLKEVSYIHSEAYQAGELKHGTISLISDGMPVFGIITDEELADKTMSNLKEVKARGAQLIIITKENLKTDTELELTVPNLSDFTISLVVMPILQLIAYNVALLRNCDIDKPKNLAKSVTVE